jgi:hypothetical protein
MSLLLNYECLSQFKKQFYEKVLSFENLIPEEIKIDKVSFPDGGVDEQFNFWGYQLEKDGKKYLLPSRFPDGTELHIQEILPIIPQDVQKVATRGNVYYLINKPVSVRFKPEKCMSFKELSNTLNDFEHSNPTHRLLLVFMGLSQVLDRANYRVSSPAGFGKDSVVDIFGNLIGNCATIENPTIAKLEYMTNSKWLAVNEIVDIQKTEWRNIEQFLLSAGAFKPEITKHSRAIANGVKEVLNISNFSLSLMYNDIDHYSDMTIYVDFVTKEAVLDRFPAFRLSGVFKEDFNKVKGINVQEFVNNNFDKYKSIIYTLTYFKENVNKELKRFNTDKLNKFPARWTTNINRLLKIIDLYCDTQEEFDMWIKVINDTTSDYKIMINDYVKAYNVYVTKHGDVEAFNMRSKLKYEKDYSFKQKADILFEKKVSTNNEWFK